MTSARYREIGVRMENFQKALPGYVQQIGWTVKKTIPGTNSFMLELKKGFFDKAVIKARGAPQGLYVEIDGLQEIMDVTEIPLEKKEPFRKTGEETLNVEINAQASIEKAKGLALQELRSRYTFVSRFNVGAYPVGEPELICIPWWFVEYRMDGRSYSMIIDACNGSVIAGQRPWLPKGVIGRR